jgi:hypothetical protein
MTTLQKTLFLVALAVLFLCCKKEEEASNPVQQNNAPVPDSYKKIYGAISITSDGNFVYIKANGLPDHKSVYYNSSNALYEGFSGATFKGTNFSKNPNSISSQSYTFKIPVTPAEAATKSATP